MSSLLIAEEWRDLWAFKAEFLIAALSYLFATTNLLNLPNLILQNGGLAFVAAYGISLVVVVLPVMVLELTVGQVTGRGPVQALYNICPIFKGVGVSQIALSLFFLATSARFLVWLLLFVFHLFWTVLDERPGLPWINCESFPEVLSADCRESASLINSSTSDGLKLATMAVDSAFTEFMAALEKPSNSIAEIGGFQLYFLIGHAVVWGSVFMGICFGVRWLGKVVVFTFMTPLCLLLILVARVLFLSGALPMFERLFEITDWERLAEWTVWKAAIEQSIMATGIGFGVFITIGSYNKRSSNLVRDSVFMIFGHSALTALQLIIVFGLLGFVSHKTSTAPLDILSYGEAQMWNILVYLSLVPSAKLFTGILLFAAVFIFLNVFYLLSLNVLATLEDALGEKFSRCFPRFCLALFVCLIGYALSIYFSTQAGKHAYELAAGFLKYITLWLILFFELLAVAWFYCAHSLGKDLRSMLEGGCCWCFGHFLLFLTYIIALVPITIAVLNVINYDYAIYSPEIRNWEWSEWIGWAIAVIPLLPIPLFALYIVIQDCRRDEDMSKKQKFRQSFRSPLRYELMKSCQNTATNGASATNRSPPHDGSPRYNNAGVPGYTLLPQADLSQPAPLAEPESYDVYGGPGHNIGNTRDIPIRRI